jgi:glyoxylase-like metal-dependent hydrolase (beta-lactamase superfamily II)
MIDGGLPNKSIAFQKFVTCIPINPNEIRLIILTHGDFDHVGSAPDIKLLTGAKIAIHEDDRLNFENSLYNWPPGTTSWGRFLHFLLNPILKISLKSPGEKCDIVLDNSDCPLYDFGINGKIVYTPGHTKGSVSVLLETGEAFVGCMAHNNFPFRFRPGLPIFAEDIDEVKESWKSLIQRGVRMIYPAHGDPFPVDVIKNILNN